ncbi:MAG: DUF1573 domain-containing protein, partial [Acidobacteriota bacterium]|nr:DUF1573 domain-containing protein [Acidobacteriota bacterium]
MKKLELGITVLAVTLVPTLVLAQPRAVVVDPIKDVGVVSRGQKIDHRFEIRNEGTSELTIREVKPACGCTIAEFDRTIAPGASGSLHAVVDTKDFRGPIAKSVTVFTTDPENAKFNVVIKADVRSQIETRPGYSRMIVVQGEPTEMSQQWLWASEEPDFEIRSVKSPYPFLQVGFREATEQERKSEGAKRQWLVEMTLSRDAPVGPLADHVIVRTDHPRQQEVRIPVSGFVRPVVSVRPRVANFGRLELTGPFSAVLDVENLGSGKIS